MNRDDSAHFVAKWLDAEPWHRLLLVFEPPERRRSRRLIESLAFELRSTALDSSDARVTMAKLGWWAEEWLLLIAGAPRHPVTQALASLMSQTIDAQAGSVWIAAAAGLADDISDADTDTRIERWQRYTQAQSEASIPWLPAAQGDARVHAASLLMERIAHARSDVQRGRLPVPLDAMARHALTRAQLAAGDRATFPARAAYAGELAQALRQEIVCDAGGYRRGQAALARLRAHAILRTTKGAASGGPAESLPPLPPLRSAWAAWRAFKSA